MSDPSVLVVGAGAIGGVIAAKMTAAGLRVAVLDVNRAHVELMRDPGLLFEDLGEKGQVRVDAHTDAADVHGRLDLALVTLKATHLEAALRPVVERDLANAFVSLGNGLVQDRIANLVGADRLIVGTVEWGAATLAPGHVAKYMRAPFVIGELDGRPRERTRRLARALETVAEVRLVDDIRGQIWSKLLMNSVFSGLGAISGLLYRDVVADPTGRRVAYALWREGYDVGVAEGIRPDEVLGVPAEDLVVRDDGDLPRADEALAVFMRSGGDAKASMLEDLERGVPTEVDVINGGVVQRGRRHGIPTPLHERVVELVHACERGERWPSREAFGELDGVLAPGCQRLGAPGTLGAT
jgi:2-dehydropantoate 2-reductase